MSENINPEPEQGQFWEDSMFDTKFKVKYSDDEITLLYDVDGEKHQIYPTDMFLASSERTLTQTENRFKLITENDSQ